MATKGPGRRPVLKGLAAAALLPNLGIPLSAHAASGRPLNILFFLVDDQRNDTLGCAGHPFVQTPAIDQLAAEGTLFENAFVTTPICPVSRASILTSLTETTHGFTFGKPPLEDRFLAAAYPRVLRNQGYLTGFIGKYGIEASQNAPKDLFDIFHPIDRNPYFKDMPGGGKRHTTELCADRAVEFLDASKAEQPFCLSISFNAAHAEDTDLENHFPSPTALDGLYEDVTIPPPRLSDPVFFNSLPDFLKASLNRVRFGWRWDTREKYQKNMRGYFRMITGIDRAIERIRATLEAKGLLESTLIVYTSDNGFYMGDRGLAGKWSHFDQSLRVPMIVRDPRTSAGARGQRLSQMALNIDLAPTFLAAADIDPPSHYQGRDLGSMTVARIGGGSVEPPWRKEFF